MPCESKCIENGLRPRKEAPEGVCPRCKEWANAAEGCCEDWLHHEGGTVSRDDYMCEDCDQTSADPEPAATRGRTAESFNDDGDGWK